MAEWPGKGKQSLTEPVKHDRADIHLPVMSAESLIRGSRLSVHFNQSAKLLRPMNQRMQAMFLPDSVVGLHSTVPILT
jgi:hypothetical protein